MSTHDRPLDSLFRDAVTAMDAGDVPALERLLREHPRLVIERLKAPGPWLRDKVGRALKGFFKKPFLLWFVAEDPVRNGKLPANIAQIASVIIAAAKREGVEKLPEQLDYALTLVCWSWIAKECGVQLPLIDVLVDAGASPDGNPNNALVNGHFEAAEHLVARGATLTLAMALCLGRWDEVDRLALTANARQKQFAFILAALNGKDEALRRVIPYGVKIDRPSTSLYSHATALHHAVCSGSLDAVRVLVEAGARLNRKDTVNHGTPLGWAEYYVREHPGDEKGKRYEEIAVYLREKERQLQTP